MAFVWKRQRQSIDRRRSLKGEPVLHDDVSVLENEDGTLSLRTTVRRGTSFLDRFRPAVTERNYKLDEFGTFVVREIQKEKTVFEIMQAFERRYRMSHRECELGVVAFVKMLMKRNMLSVVLSRSNQ